jgi:hypothetical protein
MYLIGYLVGSIFGYFVGWHLAKEHYRPKSLELHEDLYELDGD